MHPSYKILFVVIGILLLLLIYRVSELHAQVELLSVEMARCVIRDET
jgi:hypothetical protein